MHAPKSLKNSSINLILIIAIAASLLFGAFASALCFTKAAAEDIKEFAPSSLGLSNTNFDSSSGSSYPASPTGWTGAAMDGGSGAVTAGVVDLTPKTYFGSNSGNTKFKLDQYDEYKDEKSIPQTIFGADSKYADTDAKALLINTGKNAEAAYGYTSGDMTFAANSFYRVSAWVKTGDFAPDTGATIKLTGLGKNVSFLNINTVRNIEKADGIPVLTDKNDYGWVKYTIYVRTSAAYSKTVKLVLGVGNAGDADDEKPAFPSRPAHGYALFDTVSAERITARGFAAETEHFTRSADENVYYNYTGNMMAVDLYDTQSMTADGKEIGTFSQNVDMWKQNVPFNEYEPDGTYAGKAHSFIYNTENIIPDLDDPSNINGFTQNPWSPLGRAEYGEVDNVMFEGERVANIMVISTYNGKDFAKAAYGIASPTVHIDRYGYYRFGVWIKGDSVAEGDGINIRVLGKSAASSTGNYGLLTSYTSLAGDSSDAEHYGWKEHVVYIKGSTLNDYDVRFELWLGTPTAMSSGIAMFDNVTFTPLKYSEYSAMSGADGGNVYTLDSASTGETGITNGNFMTVGDFDELEYPLPAANWTYYTPDTISVSGNFSKEKVNTDNAVYGLLPCDEKTFDSVSQSGKIPGVNNPASLYKPMYNALLLSSVTPTAFCYQSSAITLSASTANKLTVTMAVDGVSDGSYGASLVLRTTDGEVISTIENITTTARQFLTYTFYLDAPRSDKSVYLEIWLGLNDRRNNASKLSDGNIYVREAALTAWTAAEGSSIETEYGEVLAKYKKDIADPAKITSMNYGVYSFGAPNLDYYDIYDYSASDGYAIPYQWTASSANAANAVTGMFNTENRKNLAIYSGFDAKDLSGNMLYIFNTDRNRTTYTYGNTITLGANVYYRLDVTLKVRVSDEVRKDKTSVGATLTLTNTSAEFTNIKDTTTLVSKGNEDTRDYETFKTYSFYIATGENGGDIGLQVALGGADVASYIQGKLIIGDITMTEIDNVDFENAEADTKNAYSTAVRLSEDAEPDDNTDDKTEQPTSEIQWWIIPTIIFSAALVAVVILIIVIRLRDYFKKKKKVTYTTEYDRHDVMRDIERLQAQKDADERNAVEASANAPEQTAAEAEPDEVQDEQPEQEQPEQEQAPAPAPVKPRVDTDLDD